MIEKPEIIIKNRFPACLNRVDIYFKFPIDERKYNKILDVITSEELETWFENRLNEIYDEIRRKLGHDDL